MKQLYTNAGKVIKIEQGFATLREEYAGRPDVQHAIDEAMNDLPPASKALLFDILMAN